MSVYRNQVAITVVSNIAVAAMGLISGLLLARLLGPAARGELAAIQVWGSFGVTLALLGLPDALLYRIGQEPHKAKESWITAVALALTLGTPMLMVSYWTATHVLAQQSKAVSLLLGPFMFSFFVLNVIGVFPLSVLWGLSDVMRWNILRILPTFGWVAVILYAATTNSASLRFLVIGFLGSYWCVGFATAVIVWRRVQGVFRVDLKQAGIMLRYGLPLAASAIPYWLVHGGRLAQLYVSALLDPNLLGYLAVAVTFAEALLIVPNSIAAVVVPRVLEDVRQTGLEYAAVRFGTTVRLTVLIMMCSSILLLLTVPWAIPILFGEAFRPAIPTALFLVGWAAIEGVRSAMVAALRGFGKPGVVLLSDVGAALVSMLFLGVLLPRVGLVGVGWASMLGGCAGTYVAWRAIRRFVSAQVNLVPGPADVKLAVFSLVALMTSIWRFAISWVKS